MPGTFESGAVAQFMAATEACKRDASDANPSLLTHGKGWQPRFQDTPGEAAIGGAAHLHQTRGAILLPGGGGHGGGHGDGVIFVTEVVEADEFVPRGGRQHFRLGGRQNGLEHVDIVGANDVQIIGNRGVLIKIFTVFINEGGDQLIKRRGAEQTAEVAYPITATGDLRLGFPVGRRPG